jgi:hypothetical protein
VGFSCLFNEELIILASLLSRALYVAGYFSTTRPSYSSSGRSLFVFAVITGAAGTHDAVVLIRTVRTVLVLVRRMNTVVANYATYMR